MKYSRKEIDLNYLKETLSFLISVVNPAKQLENKNASLFHTKKRDFSMWHL